MSNEMKISVAEIFSSIQGEGPTIGYPSIFLRLGGCNLMCGGEGTQFDKQLHNGATWRCDTIEVWQKGKTTDIRTLIEALNDQHNLYERLRNGWHLIITGGEPFQQCRAIKFLLQMISYEQTFNWNQIEFETNGTIWNDNIAYWGNRGCQINVSPKLANSGETNERRYKRESFQQICNLSNTFFKFVCNTEKDIEEVKTFFDFVPREKIYLMPGASNEVDLKKVSIWLAEEAMKMNVKFSSRLQVAIWNEVTGV